MTAASPSPPNMDASAAGTHGAAESGAASRFNPWPAAPLWTIMIAHLASRRDMLLTLLGQLLPQAEADGRVTVIGCCDNGELPLPVKRQLLLDAARALQPVYVSFMDDDDQVDGRIVAEVTAAMTSGPDMIQFDHLYYVDGVANSVIRTGLHLGQPRNNGGEIIRPVTHIQPVRAGLTGGASFGGVAPGEDRNYVLQVWPRLETQAAAGDGRPLYHYRHRTHDSAQRALAPHTGLPRLEVDSPCFRWIEVP